MLLLLAVACALGLLLMPRVVEPAELPGLRLAASEVREVLRKDREASTALTPDSEVSRLEKLLLDKGESERNPAGSPDADRALRLDLREGLAGLRGRRGEKAVTGLRARAAARFESALDLALPGAEARAVLGSFPATLRKYDAARDGELVAPRFVVRTMYKARWNLLHGLEPTEGFASVEQQAFYGWLALHADSSPIELRLRALEQFARFGGERAAEARGVLLFRLDRVDEAVEALEAARTGDPSVRLRNYLLGARSAAGR